MGFWSSGKTFVNTLLAPMNLKLETLTAAKHESKRLRNLEKRGHFDHAIFAPFAKIDDKSRLAILQGVEESRERFKDFYCGEKNSVGYMFANDYFHSPDVEILYAIIKTYQPRRIIEVGSGNSTKVARQSIVDARLTTEIVSIDPSPRCDVGRFADRVVSQYVETLQDLSLFDKLGNNDILFIDSSHEIRCGNDVVFLLLKVIPNLKPGVLIHLHDIFLPFEYPREWIIRNKWTWCEQYIVQALFGSSAAFEVIWAGHYFQRTDPAFKTWFREWQGQDAKSLWVRKQ